MQSTRLAKAIFWVGGQIRRIKTYRKTYAMVNADEWFNYLIDGGAVVELEWEMAGRVWLPCSIGIKMIDWARYFDTEHFDHWAYVHDNCDGGPCEDCGGSLCETLDDEWDEDE